MLAATKWIVEWLPPVLNPGLYSLCGVSLATYEAILSRVDFAGLS